jgi:uncharacterized protein YgiB involved in biofilm formation
LKRSEVIVLGAIGLLMTAAFWPSNQQKLPPEDPAANAGDGFQTLAFASLDECKASQAVTAQTCSDEFGRVSKVDIADAPKFEALSDCEGEYGANQCRPATWNGASVFVPALAGVLIARSLANAAANRSQPLYPPRTGPVACPPGISTIERPECAPRSSGSSSGGGGGGSSSGGSSSRSYYSTGTGRTVGRTAGSYVADGIVNLAFARTPASRSTAQPPSSAALSRSSTSSGSTSSSTSISRPSSSTSSPSPTVSRSGFGSTGRSFSTSS